MDAEQLTTLFGSKTRVKLLRHFLADPEQKYYVRELTRMLDDHINAIRHELGNLESAGLVTKKRSQGRLYYRLNQHVPGVKALQGLFAPTTKAEPVKEPAPTAPAATTPGFFRAAKPEGPTLPELGNVVLLIQNGKYVGSETAPADMLFVGDPDMNLLKEYLQDEEAKHGELHYAVMSEDEYTYRRQLFDRFITQMLSEPKKIVINILRDRSLARL